MRSLVQENFRYVNGQIARNQPISVVYRGTSSLVPLFTGLSGPSPVSNPVTTDSLGNVAFYAEAGIYDFLALGARIPFDVQNDGGGSDSFSEYLQSSPAATWSVPNPIGRTPQVSVIVDGEIVLADVEYETNGTITVTHAVPTAGRVILT